MSAINPLFLLWWATVGAMLIMKITAYGTIGLPALILTHWLCDLVWLSLVSFLIYRTKALWGTKLQEWIFAVCSLLLVGFGFWYLISGIQKIRL
jgi:threonine/homoserine/homoserine lactone efflux protein